MKNANPLSLATGSLAAALVIFHGGCGRPETGKVASVPEATAAKPGAKAGAAVRYGYEVVRAWPHDPGAFTQGLVFRDGAFLESTGLVGRSSLREVELASGRVRKNVTVAPPYFAEGLAVVGDRAYLLTWQHQRALIYDADTFRALGEFRYDGEGWGLTTDGSSLILSDGTARLRFLDPKTFQVTRTIEVTLDGKALAHLNELEFIRGEIFANIWQTDEIARIDPATGAVRGIVDFSGLLAPQERGRETDVLNGIAYDAAGDRLFVTGKCWPKIFEVRLKAN